jgi:hypothetical protein
MTSSKTPSAARSSNEVDENWWPQPLRHLAELASANSQNLVIAEIESVEHTEYERHSELMSILVPTDQLPSVLAALGGIGTSIECSGPQRYEYRQITSPLQNE